MLAGPVLALGGGNNGGWGGADTDGWLQNPPDSLELGAAFGVNAANEMLVGDPGKNQVAIYHNANVEMPADDDSWAEHEYAWLVDWPDADPDDRVGSAIAVWGGAALVGAPGDGNGRVYILERDGGPGTNWSMTGSIDPPTDQPNWAGFGATIAMDPPYLLIGAPDGSEEGVARYKINGLNIDHEHSWTSPYAGTDAGFGTALAINGTRAIIGAPDADDGHAWLYAQEGGTGPWNIQGDYATISPLSGRLGASVFLSDLFAGVAAPDASNPNSNQGIVWFFRCTQDDFWNSTGDDDCDGWAMPPAEFSGGGFGTALVNWNNNVVISHTGMNDGYGGMHIFKFRNASTENVIAWTDTISISGNHTWGETLEVAGSMVWISKDDGAIGYLLNDGDIRLSADIAATVSAQALPTGTDWIPQSLDVEGSWMAGGASEEDEVVIMHEVDDAWSAVQVLDGPESGSMYGVTIRLLNGVLAVGAPMAAGGDGRVYLYTLDSSDQWLLQQTIVPDETGNRFGFSLDMCLDNLGQLVLVTGSPAVNFDSKGKIPVQFACGRFDVYRISADASTKTALHDWTEPQIASGGVVSASINSEGSDLIVAVGRVLRGVDVNDPPLTWGGITIFRGGDEPDTKWVIEADIDAPESRGAFGATTDIAAGLVTTTSPYHSEDEDEGDVDLRIDVYEQDAPGDPWVATQLLRTPDIHPNHDFGGSPRITTLFGHQAILAGSSRMQSAAGLAGSAEIFLRPGDATYGTAFRHHLRLTVQGHHDVRLGETVVLDGDNLFFAGGLFTSDDPYAGEGGVVGWARLTNTAYWNNVYGGLFEDPANWTIDPTQADRLEVSTLDSNFMMLVSSEPTLEDKPVHVRYAISLLRHEHSDVAMQLEEWTTWGDAGIQLATSSTSNIVNVTNDLRVGSGEGDAGRLLFIDDGNVTVGGSYVQASTGVLDYWFPGDDLDQAVITASNLELGGTLSLFMPNPDYELQVHDKFPVIRSDNSPISGEDRFDLVVLPGLPDGLALQVMYDDTDGGELVGDGTWDAWVQVVTLAGLLGFGDADSLSVTGTPIAIEVVDLTGDDADEICVLLDGEPGQIAIFESDGIGGVEWQYGVETHDFPTCIASGDFNGDDKNDLVVGTRGGIVTVFWNEDNDLSNGFVPEDLTAIGPVLCASRTNLDFAGPPDLVVGIDDTDEDGKGHLQFWAGQSSLRGLGGSLNSRGAKDAPGIPKVFGDPSDDEDQKPGALSAHQMVAFVAMSSGYGLVMTADPGYPEALPELEVHSVGANPGGVAVADLNGDDILDVAVTSRDNGTIALLIGTGVSSGLNPAMNIPIGSSPGSIEVIDFDGDGNLDLAATTRTPDGDRVIRVLQNDGGLSFTSVDTGLDSSPTLLSKGDIHGDDVTRLVSIGSPAGLLAGTNVMDLHNVESEPCSGDTDGNGVVNIEDLLNVIAQFGNDCEAGEECWADGDDDGDIDIEDLLIVIGGFGAC